MLHRAAAAIAEMSAARRDPIRRGAQQLEHDCLVVPAASARTAQPQLLAGQCPVDENRVAVDPAHAAAFVVEGSDLACLRLRHWLQDSFQAAANSRQCPSLRSASQARTRVTSAAWVAADNRPRINSKRR